MSKYAPTKLPGGIPRLIQVCEDLRERNTDGYLKGSLWLAKVKSPKLPKVTKAVVCSPLTGGVIAVAFDPKYPRDDLNGDPYVPLCNGGTDPLPHKFYTILNSQARNSGALIEYGLGRKIKATEMRRGDLVGVDWVAPPGKKHGGGHSTFVWDVHLNAKGEVDCFQMLGSHGSLSSNGFGLHIHGCTSDRWFKGKPAAPGKPGTGTLSKAKAKIFVDDDEIVRHGTWFLLPGVKAKDVDVTTFRVTPNRIGGHRIAQIDVGRMNYDGDPPPPYCMKGGPAAPPPSAPAPEKPGHVDAPVTTVKKAEIKKDPEAVKKVEPKPAAQEPKKPLMMQRDVEKAMQEFFAAQWIDADPGIPDDVNDPKSQAAVKAFQKLFGLKVDGIVGKHTRKAIKKQLPAVRLQVRAEELLHRLFAGGKLAKDPGPPNGYNDAGTRAALEEFQKSAGLPARGVPCADTQEALEKAVAEHAASGAKHGLNPMLLVMYWLGNVAAPGGSRKLRLHSHDVKVGQELQIFLKDTKGKEVEAKVKLKIAGEQSDVAVPVPAEFGSGSILFARVKAAIEGGKTLEMLSPVPLFVRGAAAPAAAAGVPPEDPKKYRKFRLTSYHVAEQKEASASETVPIYDTSKSVLARVTPGFFSQIALEGTGKMRDGRLLNVAGKSVSVDHDEYAGVWEYHKTHMVKNGQPRPPGYSGLTVQDDRVVRASAFHEVSASKRGLGYGSQRGKPHAPFRTLAADIGAHPKDEPKFKGKGGLVPPHTKVFIKEFVGLTCPDGTGGTFVHDGWFEVIDSGGGIFGVHFDVFVGTKELRKSVKYPSVATVWFEGIEDRIPEGYTYGLKDE